LLIFSVRDDETLIRWEETMTKRHNKTASYRLLLLIAFSISAQAAQPVPLGEAMPMILIESYKPVIDYCVTNSPQSAASIQDAFMVFRKNAGIAFDGWKVRFKEHLSDPIPADFVTLVREEIPKKTLEAAKQYTADSYCKALTQRLTQVTPEALSKSINDNFARFEELAKHRANKAQR
jgi:hypothetical protein